MSNKNVEAVLIGLICMAQKELPYQTATSFQDKAEDLIRRVLKEFPLPSPPSEDPSVRDLAAFAALQGLIGIGPGNHNTPAFQLEISKFAYGYADAMMKAREVKA